MNEDIVGARALAELVLHEVGLGGDMEPDPIDVAERLGIPCYDLPREDIGGVAGLTSWIEGGYIIQIADDLSSAGHQGVGAHELGHVCCRLWNVFPKDRERFAWIFAGALLVREDRLRESWARHRDARRVIRDWAHVPSTVTVLAIGECSIADVFVVQDADVRHARSRTAACDDVLRLGMSAWQHGTASRKGLRATRLYDATRRAAVVRDAA